jgi:hypothetical protein
MTSDLRETIERVKARMSLYGTQSNVENANLTALLTAAEASLKEDQIPASRVGRLVEAGHRAARNAALEEAAELVRQYRSDKITLGLHQLLSGIAADIEELKELT